MSRQRIQEKEYSFPYHYIYTFEPYYKTHIANNLLLYSAIIMKKVLREIKQTSNNKKISILDFGCGDGRLIYEINKLKKMNKINIKNLDGIDISERALLFAKAINYEENNTKLYNKDITKFNPPYKYDIITAIEVLEHIPSRDIPKILKSLKRLLKKNGKIIITVPSIKMKKPKKHYRHYSIEMIKKELEDHFSILKIEQHIDKKIFNLYTRILSNRFVALNNKYLLKIFTQIFGKKLENSSRHGLNILLVAKKRK